LFITTCIEKHCIRPLVMVDASDPEFVMLSSWSLYK